MSLRTVAKEDRLPAVQVAGAVVAPDMAAAAMVDKAKVVQEGRVKLVLEGEAEAVRLATVPAGEVAEEERGLSWLAGSNEVCA